MSLADNEQGEFIQAFVDEGREMLDNAEPLLIELEKISEDSRDVDPEVINTIFRLFHSLKGAAGFLDFTTISKVTHEAETLLDLFRKKAAKLASNHIDLLNRAADFIRQLLDNIESNQSDKGFDDIANEIVSDLKKMIAVINENKGNQPKSGSDKIEIKAAAAQAQPLTEMKPPPEKPPEIQISITPEIKKQFTGEAEELLEKAEGSLLALEKDPCNDEHISQAFRAIHSLKGNAGFLGFADIEQVSHQAETILDNIRSKEARADGEIFSLLLEVLDFLRNGVNLLNEGRPPIIPGKSGLVNLMQDSLARLTAMPSSPKNNSDAAALNSGMPIVLQNNMNTRGADKKDTPENKDFSDRRSGEDRRTGGDRRIADKAAGQKQSIRVDIEKLDVLMDLVGELVIAGAMVSQNPDLRGLNISLERFDRSVMQLNKITRDLQDISTSIRMIPLEGTFRKMIRLVRDLSQKVNKKVDLEILGEETEVDKTVIEQISDPLVHIIRNSVDHGLETPQDRAESGKDQTGHLTIEAKYVGGEVWILIRDDGRGLKRDKILAKAIEKGLVSGDGSDLTDEKVWQLVFLPGFSTAEKVTDVSGRGVGMDVVRRNIESIRGKVEIRSKTGQGTTVILRIPLTLAIIDGMAVRLGNSRFILPIVAIKESFRPDTSLITRTMDGQEIINVRGKLLPIVRLHDIFKMSENTHLENGIVIIVENEQKALGLFVDEVIGQQQVVIKGLSEYVGDIRTVSGCTILGDGTISLIIDVAGIIALAEGEYKGSEKTISQSAQTALA